MIPKLINDRADLYCDKCKRITSHIGRGFHGHNFRIECEECDEFIKYKE